MRYFWIVVLSTLLAGCSAVQLVPRVVDHVLQSASMPQPNSTPVVALDGGPGIVICEPVPAKYDKNLIEFGVGCSRWLQLTVGGEGELGATPAWSDIAHCEQELHRVDLCMPAEQVDKFATMLGVNYVASGVIEGNAAHCILTYRLWQVPSHKEQPIALRIEGSYPQIAAALPELALSFTTALGVQHPHRSSASDTVDLLQFVGSLPYDANEDHWELSDNEEEKLHALAGHSVLAAIMLLQASGVANAQVGAATINQILAAAPNNSLVLEACERYCQSLMAAHGDLVSAALAAFPNSCLLNRAEALNYAERHDRVNANLYAGRAIQCSVANPFTWIGAVRRLSEEAEDSRGGRPWGDMTPTQAATVTKLYAQAVGDAKQAVKLDPLNGHACEIQSFSAALIGDPSAEPVYWQALNDDGADYETLWWGLELFQPKWSGAAGKSSLVKLCSHIAADPALCDSMFTPVRNALYYSGYIAEQNRFMNEMYIRLYNAAHLHPDDSTAQFYLGKVNVRFQQIPASRTAFNSYLTLRGNSIEADLHVASFYMSETCYGEAAIYAQKATQTDPTSANAWTQLGLAQNKNHKLAEAKAALEKSLSIRPNDRETRSELASAYQQLGQYEQAIESYRNLLRDDPDNTNDAYGLGYTYLLVDKWQEAYTSFTYMLQLDPENIPARQYRAVLAFNLHKYEQAASDANKCVDNMSPDDRTTGYSVLWAYLFDRQLKRDSDAQALLARSEKTATGPAWPLPMIRYLHHDITEAQLVAACPKGDPTGEMNCYLGLDRWISGKRDADTLSKLQYVVDHMEHNSFEYPLALSVGPPIAANKNR